MDDTTNDSPEKWESERPLLVAEALRVSGHLRLRVRGESMLPSLWPGDEVEILSCPLSDVREGEVVLALRDGRFFLHRFLGRLPGGFLLRGDSMTGPDPEFAGEALLGRLGRPIPLHWWSRAMGGLFCHCGPARRLALKVHAGRRRREEQKAVGEANLTTGLVQAPEEEGPRHTGLSYTIPHPISSQLISETPNVRV